MREESLLLMLPSPSLLLHENCPPVQAIQRDEGIQIFARPSVREGVQSAVRQSERLRERAASGQ